MAFFEMKYHSDALGIGVSVNVILPEKAKTLIGMTAKGEGTYKTLYLYHGLSDDHSIWMRRTSIERYAADRGIAVVMPSVGRSWYTDTAYGAAYYTFVTQELPAVCRGFFRGMSERREDNMVAGLSMGGYGAVKVALSRPDLFFGAASLSGALDVASFPTEWMGAEWRGVFGPSLQTLADLRGTEHDLFHLAETCRRENQALLPRLYMWCGDDDFLLAQNHAFCRHLDTLGIPYRYDQSEGDHAWHWWDLHIRTALDYLLAP